MQFLELEDVLEIHSRQIANYGGGQGMRDRGLLESAKAQPQAAFGGQFLHIDIFEMAAANHLETSISKSECSPIPAGLWK